MTVAWFDLAQRLYAARTGRPVPRLAHAPIPTVPSPLAVRARTSQGTVTVTAAAPGARPATASGAAALTLLHDLDVAITAESPRTLLTDTPTTLAALLTLARHTDPDSPDADTAAHLAWWADRADFPGTGAVVALPQACRTRWITGATPDAETQPGTWRAWLGLSDDGCAGLHHLLDRLTDAPPLPLLSTITDDDAWTWRKAQSDHADGWDWRRPDTPARAASGLRARCDAADLYAAALLSDPLYRRRAVHTGHVVTGRAARLSEGRNRIAVTCERLDARLRAGNPVTGWAGPPHATTGDTFSATVTAATVTAGALTLTLHLGAAHHPPPGAQVTLTAAPPNPYTLRAGRHRYARLYSTRRSWLTTGRTPTPTRRDVPLDVLIAGAENH